MSKNSAPSPVETKRNIGFNDDLISGDLKPLADLVRRSEHLELCYRGNDKAVTVYYNSHVVFKVSKYSRGKNKYKVSFNFGHARYTEKWADQFKKLNGLGFFHTLNDSRFNKQKDNKTIKCIIDTANSDFWRKSEEVIISLIDDFFCPGKKMDYFKEMIKKTKPPLIEKIRQQEIMTALQSIDNGYFVYDIEYAQKRASINEENWGKPDMLALKFESGKPTKLVFVEVKSTVDACKGKCGVDEHYKAMKKYITNTDYMRVRKEEAVQIFNDYATTGLRGLTEKNKLTEPISLGEEILFIFTDDAIGIINDNNVEKQLKKQFKGRELRGC